jgi:hypothetical protein
MSLLGSCHLLRAYRDARFTLGVRAVNSALPTDKQRAWRVPWYFRLPFAERLSAGAGDTPKPQSCNASAAEHPHVVLTCKSCPRHRIPPPNPSRFICVTLFAASCAPHCEARFRRDVGLREYSPTPSPESLPPRRRRCRAAAGASRSGSTSLSSCHVSTRMVRRAAFASRRCITP